MNRKRLLAALLSAAVSVSAIPMTSFAANSKAAVSESAEVTGSIKATLRFDYPQLLSKVSEKNISATLYKDGEVISRIPLTGSAAGTYDNVRVTAKNTDGVEMTNESEIGYFDVDVTELPLGNYRFAFEGDGYADYKTPSIELDDYSRQVVIGTGDATFSIGDVNHDGYVDKADRDLISGALGKKDEKDLSDYDLNGDNKIDIVDLAYVNHQITAKGEAQIFDTALIARKLVQTDALKEQIKVTGEIEKVFSENNDDAVTLSVVTGGVDLAIPIELNKPSEMEQIEIVSPVGSGALTAGEADVTYIDESGREVTEAIPFDISVPEDIEMLSAREGTSSVVIALGKRVAVKKIVINVSKVEGENGAPTYAVVQEVKFLKDIIPENPIPQVLSVKNVKAEPKDKSVRLTWDEFPNVSGYTVYYGLQNGAYTSQMTVDKNSAVVDGLKNLKTYYFTVTPISEGWEGARSEAVSAMPMPSSKPLKPDMVRVEPMDSALSVSWKQTEDATYYRVFYKEDGADEFVHFGDRITGTSTAIGGLTNGTTYQLYITAGNDIGEGPRSDLAEGVPNKQQITAPKIPTLHMIDNSNIESIVMGDANNVNKGEYPNGFSVWNVADGDYATHWTARAWWESSAFTFTFKEAKEMNYMVYVPRLDGNYRKSLEKYAITVWDENGNKENLVTAKGIAINSGTTGYMILPFEKRKVKKLAVSLAQWAGSPTGVSLAEAVFYESDNLEAEVRELFANDMYTEISAQAAADKTAAQAKIESLRAQANDANGYYVDKDVLLDELNLAERLLNGDSSALGYVKDGVESRSTSADSAKYKQTGSDLQPLGVVAYATQYAESKNMPQTKLTVYAHIPEGETAYLVPTQYYAEANAWQGGNIPLQNGRNIIEIPKLGSQTTERGGSLYLRYSGNNPDEVSLQFRQGATEIPVLQLSDWYKISETERSSRISNYIEKLEAHTNKYNMSQTGIYNSTELSLPNVLLSVPADRVLVGIKPTGADNEAAAETLYNNVLAWEDLMHVVNTTQGIDNTLENSDMESRQNIRYMRMFAKAFMYAAGNHIGIGYGSVAGLCCGKPVSMLPEGADANSLFGWGIAHEIGHNMDKLGKAEITNNIYSLMAQTYDGKENTLPSRLEKSNKYKGIYKKVAEGRPGMSNDVFVQLGMYWQLHLAYDDSDGFDFYNKVFKEWKEFTEPDAAGDERFALIASRVAGKNLTEFFESWGMILSDDVKDKLKKYPSETRKIQYLNDESRRYRLKGGASGSGVTTAEAKADSADEKRVNLTFSSTADKGSVLGYEIKRNGKTIAFVTGNEYTDTIGSANNRAFSYTVQAIDMLGNAIGSAANAGQVRISYVKTVEKDKYDMLRRNDGTINVVFNDETSISGIKVTPAPKEGRFEVQVRRYGADDFVTAKDGSFDKSDSQNDGYYMSYFNKPEAGSSDTRIWTYDAMELEISGVPKNADVEFISYAGDNIEFTDGAAVGILKNDYVYGEESDEVIKAGTLVVTGTYRGDPKYNTVQINGRFSEVDTETHEQIVTERAISGYSLLFAEIPEDGEVSEISDGIFIFVPDVQKEAELRGDVGDCSAESLLPAQINAELYRTDTADSTESKRLTSDTIWIDSPSYDAMPEIILESDFD